MLRIQRNDAESHRVVLIVQGYIVPKWDEVLENECMESRRTGRDVVLDLSGVVFISRSGFEVLGRLARSGVGIFTGSPLIASMLEQEGIRVRRHLGDANDA